MIWIVAAWLAAINAVTLFLFALDKARARKGGRRVPEPTLLRLAAIGGTGGAKLGQRLLRHKTAKQPFARILNGLVVLHLCVAAGTIARLFPI